MHNSAELMQAAYDRIATGYDDRWSIHIREPQQRLTRALKLKPGMRCADIGCGTGVDTIEMAQWTAPEPVLAVDFSPKMLEEARARAARAGHRLSTICSDGETFITHARPASLDVLSLRFCLAYLPWRDLTAPLARALRPDGRLGILTNLATSTPQAFVTYRAMVEELGVPSVAVNVPASIEELEGELARAALHVEQAFTHRFRLWFDDGAGLSAWLAESGFVTHPALTAAPAHVQRALWGVFAQRIEGFREAQGIPLDFELAGVVAVRAAE